MQSVATGEEALELARLERPSLVLVDVNLEGMSGYDVCRILRANFGDAVPIIFVSGDRTEAFDRVAGLRLGADDYLVKPVDPTSCWRAAIASSAACVRRCRRTQQSRETSRGARRTCWSCSSRA